MHSPQRKSALTSFVALTALLLLACPPTSGPVPSGFGITAMKGSGRNVVVRGQKFTPGGQLKITYANIPNRWPRRRPNNDESNRSIDNDTLPNCNVTFL